ncbi:MAG TPA: hypothetical protein VKU00_17435 [Chthonomonadaceae bacterium]|nr:hypothetical protein [Chthonomonadaceae bacterium]
MSLNDFYFSKLSFPVVPMFGTVLFIAATLALPRPQLPESARKKHVTTLLGLGLSVLIFLSALWGLAAFKSATIKGPAGVGFGVLLFCITMLQEDNPEYKARLFRFLNAILAIHLLAWLVQYISIPLFHTYLDYLKPITGMPSRYGFSYQGVSVNIVRCTGLFAEPAAYATFMFMGISARMIRSGGKLRFFDLLLIVSIAGSMAITGFVLIFVCLALWGWRSRRASAIWVTLLVLSSVGFVLVVMYSDLPVAQFIQLRLQTPSSDNSIRIRTQDALEGYTRLPESAQIFGIGFGNYDVAEKVSNGLLNILIYLGMLGGPLVSIVFVGLLCQRRFPRSVWLFLMATLPFAPPFTLALWWLWIGQMVLYGQDTLRSQGKVKSAWAGAAVFSERTLSESG